MSMNPASELRKASQFERLGQHANAASAYRTVLARFPQREDANTGLLAALENLGAWDEVEVEAARLNAALPGFLPAWLVLARARLVTQRDALAVAQRCVSLAPRHPGAQDYLGIACRRAGRLDEAAAAFQASLRLRPGHLSTQSNLANVLREMGRLAQAMPLYETVLQAAPERLDVAHNYALALSDLGDYARAESLLRALLASAPQFAQAHNALGTVLQALNRLSEAERCFKAALACQPDLPDLADAVSNLVLVLHNQSKLSELEPQLGRAVALMPASSMFRLTELVAALPKVARDAAEAQACVPQFDAGLADYARWRAAALADASLRHDSLATLPFYLAYRPGNHRDRLARFSDACSQGKAWPPLSRERLARSPGGPIRLGIVSAHVRRHSVWDIVLKGLVQHLDPTRFELTIYHLGVQEDGETAFAKSAVPRWRDAASLAGSAGWADLIARDAQDVLYYPEIGMNPQCYLLAQQRLAPLQCAGWGHPVTTGIAAIDLFVSGELIEPEDGQDHYRETLLKLPGTGCCTTAFEVAPQPCAALAHLQAPDARPSLLIAQALAKFAPEFDALLVEIAQRLGPCRFVIPVADNMAEPGQRLRARLARAFEAAGLDADAHLDFVPWLSEGEFRQALQICTVFLDCPAFSGYTTAWKALRDGIPVVTWEGPFMRQRLAAGLLRKVGLADWVAASLSDYVDKAVALAQATLPEQLARRQRITAAASLADGDVSVVRAFERELTRRVAPELSPR